MNEEPCSLSAKGKGRFDRVHFIKHGYSFKSQAFCGDTGAAARQLGSISHMHMDALSPPLASDGPLRLLPLAHLHLNHIDPQIAHHGPGLGDKMLPLRATLLLQVPISTVSAVLSADSKSALGASGCSRIVSPTTLSNAIPEAKLAMSAADAVIQATRCLTRKAPSPQVKLTRGVPGLDSAITPVSVAAAAGLPPAAEPSKSSLAADKCSRKAPARRKGDSELPDSGFSGVDCTQPDLDNFLSDPYIKRPMNSFMIWSKDERPRLARGRPDLANAEISRLLGGKWAEMSLESKKPFVEQAKQLKARHAKAFPTYKYRPQKRKRTGSALPDDEIDASEIYCPEPSASQLPSTLQECVSARPPAPEAAAPELKTAASEDADADALPDGAVAAMFLDSYPPYDAGDQPWAFPDHPGAWPLLCVDFPAMQHDVARESTVRRQAAAREAARVRASTSSPGPATPLPPAYDPVGPTTQARSRAVRLLSSSEERKLFAESAAGCRADSP